MERLKNMSLKKSLFLLTFSCLSLSLILVVAIWIICNHIQSSYSTGGIIYSMGEPVIQNVEKLTEEQQLLLEILSCIQILSCILLPVGSLIIAGALFYRLKCKTPIEILQNGVMRIENRDLDFSIPVVSGDELGQLCTAFETMRKELLKSNQEIWRQAEERKRLNAAFSHDLRNPVTVLKGTVKLLRQDIQDEQALNRLEDYTLRIEQYVESMSSIQKLEQLPIQKKEIPLSLLEEEISDTAKLLAPSLSLSVTVCNQIPADSVKTSDPWEKPLENKEAIINLDHGLFLTVTENLIGNAVRFAKHQLSIKLVISNSPEDFLILSVSDDGPGYPETLIQKGPKPFEKTEADSSHFGMGLYSSQIICTKHGGKLVLENKEGLGASATAFFQI